MICVQDCSLSMRWTEDVDVRLSFAFWCSHFVISIQNSLEPKMLTLLWPVLWRQLWLSLPLDPSINDKMTVSATTANKIRTYLQIILKFKIPNSKPTDLAQLQNMNSKRGYVKKVWWLPSVSWELFVELSCGTKRCDGALLVNVLLQDCIHRHWTVQIFRSVDVWAASTNHGLNCVHKIL